MVRSSSPKTISSRLLGIRTARRTESSVGGHRSRRSAWSTPPRCDKGRPCQRELEDLSPGSDDTRLYLCHPGKRPLSLSLCVCIWGEVSALPAPHPRLALCVGLWGTSCPGGQRAELKSGLLGATSSLLLPVSSFSKFRSALPGHPFPPPRGLGDTGVCVGPASGMASETPPLQPQGP